MFFKEPVEILPTGSEKELALSIGTKTKGALRTGFYSDPINGEMHVVVGGVPVFTYSSSKAGKAATVIEEKISETTIKVDDPAPTDGLYLKSGSNWVKYTPPDVVTTKGEKGDSGVVSAIAPIFYDSIAKKISAQIGDTVGTLCAGNDKRLSDARVPLSHTHTASDFNLPSDSVVYGVKNGEWTAINDVTDVLNKLNTVVYKTEIGTLASQSHDNVSISGGSIIADYIAVKDLNVASTITLHSDENNCAIRVTKDSLGFYVKSLFYPAGVAAVLIDSSAGCPKVIINPYGSSVSDNSADITLVGKVFVDSHNLDALKVNGGISCNTIDVNELRLKGNSLHNHLSSLSTISSGASNAEIILKINDIIRSLQSL